MDSAGDEGEPADTIERLLGAAPEALHQPAPPPAPAPPVASGRQLGRYCIEELVGEGGMGVVYRATQEKPDREVALKLVRPDLGGYRVARRFEYEADALGRLHHSGIAQIYDAGSLDIDGVPHPFIAMELVEGRPLDAFVEGLVPAERLELLAKLCDAVDHAHRNGVIHRDLKPANVLVTADGQPKVLDFGLARALDSDVMATTLQTRVGELLGTVPYMSPEQVAGDPARIDHRTDIYSLGVIAHQMLAGKLPYELPETSVLEALEVIRARDPVRLGSVRRDLRGDVETIVLKALEKEKERRYASAGALADDLRRFLSDQPIVARPASVGYQLRKFARRHRGLVAGLVVAFLSLVVGLITTITWYVRASEHAARAEAEAAEARAARARVERQLYRSNLSSASDALDAGRVPLARELLDGVPAERRGWEWRHLASRLDGSIAIPFGAHVRSPFVELSDDGTLVTIAPLDPPAARSRAVLETSTGEELLRLGYDHGAHLMPGGGELLRFVGESIERWDVATGELVATSPASFDPAALPFAANGVLGRYAFRGRGGMEVRDARTDSPVDLLEGKWQQLAYSADGRFLALSKGTELSILDAATHEPRYEHRLPGTVSLGSLAFHPSGSTLAAGAFDGVVYLLHLGEDAVVRGHQLRGLQGHVTRAAWSTDGRLLAAGDGHGRVSLWDARTGNHRADFAGHSGWVSGLAFRPGTGELLSSDSDSQIRAWSVDSESLSVLRGHESYVYPVAVSPDGRRIVSGGWDGMPGKTGGLRWWDAATGAPIAALGGPRDVFFGAAFTPDGAHLLAGTWTIATVETAVLVLDAATSDTLLRFEGHGASVVERVVPHPDGRRVLSVDREGTALLWELASGDVAARFDLETEVELPGLGVGAAVSPDGRLLALPMGGTRIRLVDAESGEDVRSWDAHGEAIWSLAFTPDGGRLLSASTDDTVGVWNVATGERVARLAGHGQDVLCVAASPDGERIATGGRDGFVRLWDTEHFEQLVRLGGHESYVYSLAWSPDGTWLVSGSGDQTVRIWETHTIADRHAARRERDALVRRLEPLVVRTAAAAGRPAEVARALRGDGSLTPGGREVALQVYLSDAARFGGSPPDPFFPEVYRAEHTTEPIEVDGRLDEPAWERAAWTSPFVDIEGIARPLPRFATRAKMLWDDEYLYVAADLEEPHVWGTLTEHDSIVFRDNDFEVFVDPDRDARWYYEIEVNALGTIFDLLLDKPYREGGKARHDWNADGLLTGVHVDGTLDDPSDVDRGWSVELAIPFALFEERSDTALPPAAGDLWRINFSRVQWQHTVEGNRYRKVPDTPEDNWVWSAQHVVNMHRPRRWGFLEFGAPR